MTDPADRSVVLFLDVDGRASAVPAASRWTTFDPVGERCRQAREAVGVGVGCEVKTNGVLKGQAHEVPQPSFDVWC
jgi:hypothetical protein